MPCNTEFGYALQPDSRIHALQHIVWLRDAMIQQLQVLIR